MTDERWQRLNQLFHLALERSSSDRGSFLDAECAGDVSLRAEVQSLLDTHSRAGAFLDDPMLARQIGQYRIERLLGRGGMGVVYLAEDTRLGRRVALKAIAPEFTHDLARRERLRREARAAAALTHPGVATIYALEEIGDEVFIAAEFVAGVTLRDEIAQGAATPEQTITTAIELATALAAAHDRGIVHRDLKPENVIRMPSGHVKILDFGLAQVRDESVHAERLADDGKVIGTPAYMAPEQIRREVSDGRADLFSLGIMMFELLTGRHPFAASNTASTIARILEVEPNFPAERSDLEELIRVCLSKSPESRFASAHALVTALRKVSDGSFVRQDAAKPAPAMRWWQIHQAVTCVAYAALMVPLWWSRSWIGGRPGFLTFLAGLVATVVASVLRLHLWFAASSIPEEWRVQRERSHPWLRAAEFALVVILAGSGFWVLEESPALAATLVCAAVAVLLSFALIEPATTRAAFKRF